MGECRKSPRAWRPSWGSAWAASPRSPSAPTEVGAARTRAPPKIPRSATWSSPNGSVFASDHLPFRPRTILGVVAFVVARPVPRSGDVDRARRSSPTASCRLVGWARWVYRGQGPAQAGSRHRAGSRRPRRTACASWVGTLRLGAGLRREPAWRRTRSGPPRPWRRTSSRRRCRWWIGLSRGSSPRHR